MKANVQSKPFARIEPAMLIDFYKPGHMMQYPKGTSKILANFTPRSARLAPVLKELFDNKLVWFGLQGFIRETLIDMFNRDFFNADKATAVGRYQRRMDTALGPGSVASEKIAALHDLGYLPLEIRSLPEGSRVNLRVPPVTITETDSAFAWLVTYIETLFSTENWKPSTVATVAFEYRKLLTYFAKMTGSSMEFVDWQGHDFSMRGMSGFFDARRSGAGHLLSFTGTDTVPAIDYLEDNYLANAETELIGGSVPATEHSVMCMGSKDGEFETYRRLVQDVYPSGIVSIVSDTWNYWGVLTDYMPRLKSIIEARKPDALGNAKVVIRPDSGDPVRIVAGYRDDEVAAAGEGAWRVVKTGQVITDAERKGSVECLWDVFGGSLTDTGYKMLNPRVGVIYGDSITLDRAKRILVMLEAKGFASGNVVFGIGSYTYQMLTRDSFGFAYKATYAEIDGQPLEIFKDPITDSGVKKSAKGLLRVEKEGNDFVLYDQQTPDQAEGGALIPVFRNSQLLVEQSLSEIRQRLKASWECPQPGSIQWD